MSTEQRLAALLWDCGCLREFLDNLAFMLCTLEDGVKDQKKIDGESLGYSLRFIRNAMNEQYSHFATSMAKAKGEAA